MENILNIQNLHVEYHADGKTVHAVNGIDLSLDKKQTLGLVGETGAGKTTTALALLRLIPNPPGKITAGEVWFNGENLLTKSEREMRKIRGNKISMIFQDPMTALNPVLTVSDQIAEVIRIHQKCSRKEAEKRAGDDGACRYSCRTLQGISPSIVRRYEAEDRNCHRLGLQSAASDCG